MIKLIQFPRMLGLPNPSPFCIKVEVLLKMAGLAYECEFVGNPGKGPKGKLPAIVDDGQAIGDSELIRWHLERKYGVDFDKGLGPAERAVGHAFARMAEERTYWVLVYSRWIEEANWPLFRDTLFKGMPGFLRAVLGPQIRKRVKRMLRAQGLGLHSRDEIYAMGGRYRRHLGATRHQAVPAGRRAHQRRCDGLALRPGHPGATAGITPQAGDPEARESRGLFRAHARAVLRLEPREEHQQERCETDRRPHRMQTAPARQQVARFRAAEVERGVLEPFVGGPHHEEREGHHGAQDESRDDPDGATAEESRGDAEQRAEHGERRLHDGGATVARPPFRDRNVYR
jgi:glutathione S-transferase